MVSGRAPEVSVSLDPGVPFCQGLADPGALPCLKVTAAHRSTGPRPHGHVVQPHGGAGVWGVPGSEHHLGAGGGEREREKRDRKRGKTGG